MLMSQQLHLFPETASVSLDAASDPLIEQTRQLFQHTGSNLDLMTQIMSVIQVLNEICEHPQK